MQRVIIDAAVDHGVKNNEAHGVMRTERHVCTRRRAGSIP